MSESINKVTENKMRGCTQKTIIELAEDFLAAAKRGEITDCAIAYVGNGDHTSQIALSNNPITAGILLVPLAKAQYMITKESVEWWKE